MKIKVIGMDLALNHSAYVELTNGELSNFWYVSSIASSASKSKHGYRLVLSKSKERQIVSIGRLSWLKDFISSEVLSLGNEPDYVGIEDYAIRAEQGAHYLGEIGGIVRVLCWERGIPFRLHDPVSVKMFTAHDGTCQKDSIEAAVKERWGIDFSKYNPPQAKSTEKRPTPKQNRTTSEDLADSFAIAKMVWTEILLRSGDVLMRELHPKEVQVFNRVTKTYPVSLLDREWIRQPEFANE